MYLPNFNYHQPNTLSEAFALLDANYSIAPMAGGTDLLVEIKQGHREFEDIV